MRRSRIYEEAESNANLLAIVGNVERIAEAHQVQTVTKRRGASASRPAGTGRLICPAGMTGLEFSCFVQNTRRNDTPPMCLESLQV